MQKGYRNKELSTENTNSDRVEITQEYFFPKENPPITIRASDPEEAVEKLLKLKNKSNE